MGLVQKVYSVLVVSSADIFNSTVKNLLGEYKYNPIYFAGSVPQAKATMLERKFDIVIINSPVIEDVGMRFAIDIATRTNSIVMIAVKGEFYPSVIEKTTPYGVYVLSKPMSKEGLVQAMDWLVITAERLKRAQSKTSTLEEKMREIRLVNRAKWILIEKLKMSEEDAHYYIEKQAMDKSITKKEVAEILIDNY